MTGFVGREVAGTNRMSNKALEPTSGSLSLPARGSMRCYPGETKSEQT